jgi:hypothetical protein
MVVRLPWKNDAEFALASFGVTIFIPVLDPAVLSGRPSGFRSMLDGVDRPIICKWNIAIPFGNDGTADHAVITRGLLRSSGMLTPAREVNQVGFGRQLIFVAGDLSCPSAPSGTGHFCPLDRREMFRLNGRNSRDLFNFATGIDKSKHNRICSSLHLCH